MVEDFVISRVEFLAAAKEIIYFSEDWQTKIPQDSGRYESMRRIVNQNQYFC